ncbi:PP2C family protein-serine/threonine phosphatase [Streptomyces sp. NPDC059175]|uniref:PP2C family protein-serine/threonine phosphatase n=1 Tax=Streptomyces sp. NPDC059175 TaxID=3346757 RepID=UPI00369DD5AB
MTGPEGVARMLGSLLEAGHLADVEQLPGLIADCGAMAGLMDARVYVADLRQQLLRELTGRGPDAGLGGEEYAVDGTLPGAAFRESRVLASSHAADDCGRRRYWVPVLEGIQRLGVLRADVAPGAAEAGVGGTAADTAALRHLASLTGLLLAGKRPSSDAYARLVRTEAMRVAAEMQWKLMPPLASANDRVVLAAAMEPAYEVAGDAFDYAFADGVVHLAVFDAMGHDSAAGLTANLAVATGRSQRRDGAELLTIAREIEDTLLRHFAHTRYTTGILADFDTRTGRLSWINCGHPAPVLIRGGRWTAALDCPPSHPLGTELNLPLTICHEHLEPGDRLLLYTDGITEARDARGHQFGLAHFVDFVVRHQADSLPVVETLRRLVRAVLAHHGDTLSDDATVVLMEWHGGPHDTAGKPGSAAAQGLTRAAPPLPGPT